VISEYLRSIAQCTTCSVGETLSGETEGLRCVNCGALYPFLKDGGYIDLRPPAGTFSDLTDYAEEEFYQRAGPLRPPFLSAKVKIDQMSKMLALSPEDQVLDIGCGNGRAVFFTRPSCAQMVAVDAGDHFASEAMATVDLTRGDIRRLPFSDASFDKAYSLDVLEHLTEEGVRAMLTEARRVLRPGGLLFVYSHVMMSSRLASFQRGVNRLVRWLDRRGLVDNRPERERKSDHRNALVSYELLEGLLAGAGFRIERIRYYNVVFKAVIEDLMLPLAEHNLWGKQAKRQATAAAKEKVRKGPESGEPRVVTRPNVGRWAHGPLSLATALMKLDVMLFGRIRTGPFFLLLRAVDSP
jgi:ubiquinone/menaquinone biosynthesis C-methylase UbiE